MTTLLTTREVILVKEEVTYNTDPVPTGAADAILIGNPSWAHEGLRMVERNVVKDTDGKLQQIFGGTLKTISFDVELKGSGAAGTAPDFGVLFKACGFTETVVPATSVTYDPSSAESDKKSCTIYYYQDGLLHIVTGCRGNFSVNLETGAIPMATFTFTGHSGNPTDAALPTPTYDATKPVTVRGNSFTIDAYAAKINSLTFDIGLEVKTPQDMSAADGFGEVFIGARDINGSFDPQAELVATEDFYGNFSAGASMALDTGTIGSVAGNIFKVTMGAVSYRDISPGDREMIRTYEIPFGAAETTGDDEISIIFT